MMPHWTLCERYIDIVCKKAYNIIEIIIIQIILSER